MSRLPHHHRDPPHRVRRHAAARAGASLRVRRSVVHRRSRRDQRGTVAMEFLLVVSMLIVVFLLMLQYAVRAHAHRVASAAAEEGLAAATSYQGTAADGRRVAADYLRRLGSALNGPSIDARRGGTSATVTVAGNVDQLVPFLAVRVRVRVEGPVERFVPSSGPSASSVESDPGGGAP